MSSFYEVMIERHFSSAHQLRGYKENAKICTDTIIKSRFTRAAKN
jgi:hypothetical protein